MVAADQLIQTTDRLLSIVRQIKAKQVRAKSQCETIKASALAWFDFYQNYFKELENEDSFNDVDNDFRELLNSSDRSTSLLRYKKTLKNLKSHLIILRSEVTKNKRGKSIPYSKPNFQKIISNDRMVKILTRRWDEIITCLESAPLAATIMMGAFLESLFLARINQLPDKKPIFKLKATPTDKKTKKPLKLQNWTLNNFIEVSFEMKWISRATKDVSVVLRDYRNLIHPEKELASNIDIESSDAKMFWPVFVELFNQITEGFITKSTPTETRQ